MNATLPLQALGAAGFDHVLVGGLAVQLHGFLRSTTWRPGEALLRPLPRATDDGAAPRAAVR